MFGKVMALLLSVLMLSVVCHSETVVIYPNIDGLGERGFGYQMMALVLKKTGKPYKLKLDTHRVNQERAFAYLETGHLSVIDSGIGPTLEEKADAIYIPIDRGLTGWRLFIINRNQSEDFAGIGNLNQLKTKVAGQGTGWMDIEILEHAGLKVVTSTQIEYLVRMVHFGRFDFLPLGVNEAHAFLERYGAGLSDLKVEDHIVLVYPFGQFFYVKKGNRELHADITIGLEKAYADGSFQEFVTRHPFIRDGLSKARLGSRTVLRIDNPYVSEAFGNIDPKWWYNPEEFSKPAGPE